MVLLRHRQYLVEEVVHPKEAGDDCLHRLVCLDDDAQGREVSVIWRHELGARALSPQAHGLGLPTKLDEPRHFAAYLHALKWSAVTATDSRLFQAPFRAGIHLLTHQLVPLKKALELPRVNLFIADDVGLGKTIEAGLVLQELGLRQRVELMLVVCPAAVTLQWRDEMERRFGLHFEMYTSAFVARRRQERGFSVNPWSTHNRFIVSYQTLRRAENLEPLLQYLQHRGPRKSMLILDEAHSAAPATASKYAVDTDTTSTVSQLAQAFEHRLFLSATPHNGHSNSFSALLEILDPQRFARGTRVRRAQLEPVMVRRLKEDLRALGTEQQFPVRRVINVRLTHRKDCWVAQQIEAGKSTAPVSVGSSPTPFELELARLLREYTALVKPQRARGQLVFINLQKRLLSSVEAFHRTLRVHAASLGIGKSSEEPVAPDEESAEQYGSSDEAIAQEDIAKVKSQTRLLVPTPKALTLLTELLELSSRYRGHRDAKVHALLAWVKEHQCGMGKNERWSDRRLIVFTEFGDTLRYLKEQLGTAFEDTHCGDERLLTFSGGMGDDARAQVQAAFNGRPGEYPVRVLLATDAAREGINLQGHCADLWHHDIPWNPAKMEQRNGRIDRTLQPSPEVRCHYFTYAGREEDIVLERLAEKVPTIERELGSLAAVLTSKVAAALEDEGLLGGVEKKLDELEKRAMSLTQSARSELEVRRSIDDLRRERDEVSKLREASERIMDFKPDLLRDALSVGFELAGAQAMTVCKVNEEGGEVEAWRLPELPDSWARTLDGLRPPREKAEAPWDWRRRPLNPVTFDAPTGVSSKLCQLHLSHPVVQRVMQRFLAQGFSASDLSRVSVVRSKRDSVARVVVFGRLSLFGHGAARLHDEIVSVAAQWFESGGKGHLKPFADAADKKAIEQLENTLAEAPALSAVPAQVQKRLLEAASGDFGTLWSAVEADAKKRETAARRLLTARGDAEASALREVLVEQRSTIKDALGMQLTFDLDTERVQAEQWKRDRVHLQRRLIEIDKEVATEPEQLKGYYDVSLSRLSPVGMIYLWPHSR